MTQSSRSAELRLVFDDLMSALGTVADSGILFAGFSSAESRFSILEKLLTQYSAAVDALMANSIPVGVDRHTGPGFNCAEIGRRSGQLIDLLRRLAHSRDGGDLELRVAVVAEWHGVYEQIQDLISSYGWKDESWWVQLILDSLPCQRPLHGLLDTMNDFPRSNGNTTNV